MTASKKVGGLRLAERDAADPRRRRRDTRDDQRGVAGAIIALYKRGRVWCVAVIARPISAPQRTCRTEALVGRAGGPS